MEVTFYRKIMEMYEEIQKSSFIDQFNLEEYDCFDFRFRKILLTIRSALQ